VIKEKFKSSSTVWRLLLPVPVYSATPACTLFWCCHTACSSTLLSFRKMRRLRIIFTFVVSKIASGFTAIVSPVFSLVNNTFALVSRISSRGLFLTGLCYLRFHPRIVSSRLAHRYCIKSSSKLFFVLYSRSTA